MAREDFQDPRIWVSPGMKVEPAKGGDGHFPSLLRGKGLGPVWMPFHFLYLLLLEIED